MKNQAFLFDLDGVIFDSEGQYTTFWNGIGEHYLGDPDLAAKLKGTTIESSLTRCFPDDRAMQEEVRKKLYDFEARMKFDYIPGVFEFLASLKDQGFHTAIVTSSNRIKMSQVYKSRPELPGMVTYVLTGEDFPASKPAPDCYLIGMERCGSAPEDTFIFEDSFNGLESARRSGGHVIGLATTNSREAIAPYCDIIIDDFTAITAEKLAGIFGK